MDVLDRPDLAGGWEEVWRSLESVEFFDIDQVVRYSLLLENATTCAIVPDEVLERSWGDVP